MTSNDRLAKIIAGGRKRYIIVYGVLLWGLLTAVFALALQQLYFKRPIHIADIVFAFIVFPVCGILFGVLMWARLKARYHATMIQSAK